MSGSDDLYIAVICLLGMFSVFLFAIAALSELGRDKLAVENRLKRFFFKDAKDESARNIAGKRKKRKTQRLGFGQAMATELQTAGLLVRADEFAIFWVVLSLVPSGLVALATGNLPISAALAFAGIILPPLYVGRKKKKRIAAFENQLGKSLVIVCNCLRSGLTLNQAFENISTEMGEPISREFRRLCTELKYGTPLDKALSAMVDRIGSEDLALAVSAITIQRQVGGNLSEILLGISETIKARIKLKGDIKVLTASGRVSGLIIGMLPICVGFLIFLINPEYMKVLFNTDIGKVLLAVAAAMECIGFIIVRKIIAIKY